MKRILLSLLFVAAPLLAQAQVGVSVNIGEPGFFGQINLGNEPRPPVIYANPVIVQAPSNGYNAAPMYLRVPEEHHKHWNRYCAQYNACGRQVYFVTDDWYNNSYAPRYTHGRDNEHDRGHEREHEHDNERDHERDHHDEHN